MDQIVEIYNITLEKVLPILQRQSRSSYITAAIALVTIRQFYSFFKVPKNFRGLPKVPILKIGLAFVNCMSPLDRFKKIIYPVIKDKKGFYVSKIPLGWRMYVTDPVAARHMLIKSDKFPKDESLGEIVGTESFIYKFFGDDNVAMSNGAMWKNQRKAMNPAFYRTPPLEIIEKVGKSLLSEIDTNLDRFPVKKNMHNFTLDVLGLSIFDFNFKALQGDPERWTETYNLVIQTLLDPFFIIFPSLDTLAKFIFPKRKRGTDAVERLNLKFDELIKNKRASIESGFYKNVTDSQKDVLTLMLESEVMNDDEEIRHNIAILFVAGHDTTASTLSFCLYHLAKNKGVQDKLRKEVVGILGDKPSRDTPTLEELKSMKYMNTVIKENLRMNGPVDILFSRITSSDVDIMGTIIPKGTPVSVDLNAIHHNPEYWKDPDVFNPDRFGENGEQESHEGLTWLPFSNGSRQCIGMNFSLAEQRLLLAMIVQKYEVDISKDSIHYDQIVYDSTSTTVPNSLELKFIKRF